ncbi:acyl-CoA dehydrogenase family protein [Zavarzinia sp. CC-PAN008]|uniref:acyl-CoA dehydrogenase family protein n=1 Tax=Zavarzinia sp. CC-PAN008 TaxID=3243332 RepID=UPI003F7424C2
MDIRFSEEDEAFRAEVRAFLATNLTPELKAATKANTGVFMDRPDMVAWHKALYAKGWSAPLWPAEYGGPGWTPTQTYIFQTECQAAGTPPAMAMGLSLVAPVIMKFGSPEQKQRYLPKILSGDEAWCQGYSEPGSGSDLASLQTRAVRDGDHYVVNGTKIWTTHAHFADMMFCLVRTDASGKRQDGITFLLIPMDTPGITVKPIIILGLDHDVNQVFFDDVRVPVANRIGEEGMGWTYAKYLLEFERGGAFASKLYAGLNEVRSIAQAEPIAGTRLIDDPGFRAAVDALEVEVMGIEYTEHRVMAEISRTGRPGPESSLLKTRGSEVGQKINELAIEAIGVYSAPFDRVPGDQHPPVKRNVAPIGPDYAERQMPIYLNNRASTIYGGASEIQRNIMAKAVLGL